MLELEMISNIDDYEPQCGDKIFHRDKPTEILTEHLVVEEESSGYLYLLNETSRFADVNVVLNFDDFRNDIILIERECCVYYMNMNGL